MVKSLLRLVALPALAVSSALAVSPVAEAEILGYAGVQGRWFYDNPVDDSQENESLSAVLAPEWYRQFNDNRDSLNLKLFYRHDSADEARTRGDIREAYWQHVGSDYEFTLGINKVFWGVTESQHLVDIINQTDLVEAPDGEEKLGQPMAHLALLRDWGVLDVFVMPGFRERTFPGEEGRLRSQPLTLEDGRYDSGAGDKHVDLALRWNHYLGNWSLGISGFSGTSREPLLEVAARNAALVLRPFYPQILQTGIDVQYASGDWLWKLESIYREYRGDTEGVDYFASTGGFEKTLVGILGSPFDFGALVEYSYDSRGESGMALYQNDLFIGGRLTFNDMASSEILAGIVQDMDDSDARLGFMEASTRLGNATRISLELYYFDADNMNEPLFQFRQDSFLELSVEYYY